MSLVPELNYQQGHTSDFSIKMFYVESGEPEKHCSDKHLGRYLDLLSHISLLVHETGWFLGFLSLAQG